MKAVKATKDDSGHWYLIPNELYDEFLALSDKIAGDPEIYDGFEEFEKKFGHYKTGGDLNNTQLYIK